MQLQVNDHSVFYSAGSGQTDATAPTLIFLHGAAMDHSVWVLPARYFARHGWNVVAPDLPGHGRSGGEPLGSIAELADWVIAMQDALGVSRTALVGHSLGSLISFAVTARQPDRVSQLALLGTSAPMPVADGMLNAALDNDHAAIDMANIWSHSATGKLGRSGHPGQNNLNAGMRLMERSAPGVLHCDLAACNGFQADEFGVIDATRTLIIAGTSDQMTPARAGVQVAAGIANSEQCLLPGCGHSMLSEQPNEVLDALANFLDPAA